MRDAEFRKVLAEALDQLKRATGAEPQALFGDWIIDEPGKLNADDARAAGILEGAAMALDVTVLELLDAFQLE